MMVLSQGLDERSPGVLSHNLSVCESTQERVRLGILSHLPQDL